MGNGVDLSTCDREPIHLIGAVQPHGALIAVAADTLIIEYASQNTDEFLGTSAERLLGQTIDQVIGAENARALATKLIDPGAPDLLKPWFIEVDNQAGQRQEFECLLHRNNGCVIFEFLRPEEKPAPIWEDEVLRQNIVMELVKPGALLELTDASAKMIRDVTGFDRVMIYKFAEDKHGEVIAESTNRPDSFLGLHYPASDIPDPARRHFTLNVIRSIPDLNSELVPILSKTRELADEHAEKPLDLTYSKLRGVARVHVEYLNNMGVGASLSISLITNNKLWGLVACHHYDKRLISSSRLRFVELLGGTTSALLQSIENTRQLQKSIRAEKVAYQIEQQARGGTPLSDLILQHDDTLMELFDAQGLVLLRGGQFFSAGDVPDKLPDLKILRSQLSDGIASTSHLSSISDLDSDQQRSAAGAILMDLSDGLEDSLIFFRSEFEQTIRWAGKPEKLETIGEDGINRLSPRGSFALWREERRGQSKPFDVLDLDAMRILRRALFALNSLEYEQEALIAKKKAEEEEFNLRHALLDASRASSLGELASAIAHELNQPLAAVSNYVNACRQELINAGVEVPEQVQLYMDQAVSETERAGDLIQRVRNFVSRGDLKVEQMSIATAIRQGIDLARLASSLPNLKIKLQLEDRLPDIIADSVQISQVVLNLARNAIHAMTGLPEPVLIITAKVDGDVVRVVFRDNGPGISTEMRPSLFEPLRASTSAGMGIGLSLCRSILEAHAGRIWLQQTDSGAAFAFELPINGGMV